MTTSFPFSPTLAAQMKVKFTAAGCWEQAFSARRQARANTASWRIIWSSSSVSVPTPRATAHQTVCLGMRHSPTYASPPQSLLHPQNAINVQPSFILIHSPLAQMKWIRNLVGQGRACRLPSVAELFSILPASAEGRARENERVRERGPMMKRNSLACKLQAAMSNEEARQRLSP